MLFREEEGEAEIPLVERKEVFGPLQDARPTKRRLAKEFPISRYSLGFIDFRREGRTHPSITSEALFPYTLNNCEIVLRYLRELGKGKEGTLRVLEVGCGTGWGARYLADNLENVQIIATNRIINKKDEEVFEYAKKTFTTPNLEFAEADAGELVEQYGEEEKFDAVVMLDVIEHIPQEDHSKVVEQISQIIKPGGMLLMSTPSREGYGKIESGPNSGDHVWVYGNRKDLFNLTSPHFDEIEVNRLINKIHTSTWGQSEDEDIFLALGYPPPKEMFTNYRYEKGDNLTDAKHIEKRDTCGWFIVAKKGV